MITMDNACELAASLLFGAVEWARNIPFFRELTLNDQSLLLQVTWNELFLLNASQCNMPIQATQLLILNGIHNNTIDSDKVQTYLDQTRKFQEQVEKFKLMHLDHAEYSCLKAIILFTPGKIGNSENKRSDVVVQFQMHRAYPILDMLIVYRKNLFLLSKNISKVNIHRI